MNCKIELNPTEKHLNEIKKWLKKEYKENSEGFLKNWDRILDSFEKKDLIIYENDNDPIGFVMLYESDNVSEIDIFCIQLNLRGCGYGGKFLKELEQYLIAKQIIAIILFCDPIESESFWKKEGFQKAPDTTYNSGQLTYWKSLIPIQKVTTDSNCMNKIELWDVELMPTKNHPPKWTWEITSDCLNILQYAYYQWNLRITINGKIVTEQKAKWITDKTNEFIKSPFLYLPQEYIKELMISK